MRIVWTNWKLALWRHCYAGPLALLFLVGFKLVMDRIGPNDPDAGSASVFDSTLYLALLMALPLSGWLHGVSTHERETTARPLSFCLPGYRQSLRRLCVTAAVPWGVFFALMEAPFLWKQWHLLRVGNPGLPDVSLGLGSVFLVGAAASLAVCSSRLVLSRLQWGILALACLPLGILGLIVWLSVDRHTPSFQVVAALVSILVIVFFWLRLGNMQYVARGHRAIIEDAMDKRTQVGVTRTPPSWTGDFFLAWARRSPGLGVRRYVRASLYQTSGLVLSYWKWALAGMLAVSVVLALGTRPVVEIVFASLGLAAVFVDLPATSNMLLPGGRRARYHATVTAALATSLLLGVLALGIAGLSEIVAIGLDTGAESPGFRLRSAWLACVFVPWMCVLQLRASGSVGIVNRASAILVGLPSLVAFRLAFELSGRPAQLHFLVLASVCLCGWALFLLTLKHVSTRGCLTEQKVRSGESQ